MLLLCCNVFCRNVDKGGAQNSWDTHIVHNSKGDVGGLTPKGHTKTDSSYNGKPAPIHVMEYLREIIQRIQQGVDRQWPPVYQSWASTRIQYSPGSEIKSCSQA